MSNKSFLGRELNLCIKLHTVYKYRNIWASWIKSPNAKRHPLIPKPNFISQKYKFWPIFNNPWAENVPFFLWYFIHEPEKTLKIVVSFIRKTNSPDLGLEVLVRTAVSGERILQPWAHMEELLVEGVGTRRGVLAHRETQVGVQGRPARYRHHNKDFMNNDI